MTDITVAIATFRRPDGLRTAIRSIGRQTLPPAELFVLDNDDVPSAEDVATAGEMAFPVRYIHQPGRNIAEARNACLSACQTRFLAFIDDDEWAPPDWLAQMKAEWSPGVAAVFGPSEPDYPAGTPEWMLTARPHRQFPTLTAGKISSGHTANVLIDLEDAALAGHRFDPAFGRRGGSDRVYFASAARKGAQYRRTERAIVHETIPPARLSLDWLLDRRRRWGEVYAASEGGGMGRATLAAAKLVLLTIARSSPLADRATRKTRRLRAAFHHGVMRGALGRRSPDAYGTKVEG
jgi:succinoglycan biosynthesis protein ExoM